MVFLVLTRSAADSAKEFFAGDEGAGIPQKAEQEGLLRIGQIAEQDVQMFRRENRNDFLAPSAVLDAVAPQERFRGLGEDFGIQDHNALARASLQRPDGFLDGFRPCDFRSGRDDRQRFRLAFGNGRFRCRSGTDRGSRGCGAHFGLDVSTARFEMHHVFATNSGADEKLTIGRSDPSPMMVVSA